MTMLNNSNMETQESSLQDFENFFAESVDTDSQEEQSYNTDSEEHYDDSEHEESEDRASEDESEEEESPADNEDNEEESEQESAPDFDESEFEIVVDGEPLVVKGSELKNGYMRQSAFTKKTQELAQERQAILQEKQRVVEQADIVMFQAKKKIGEMDSAIQQAGGWDKIRSMYSPEDVQKFTDMYVTAQKEAQYADGIINEYNASIKENNQVALRDTFKSMLETINGFTVDSVKDMVKYAQDSGFSDETLENITDPVSWNLMYKAMMFDKAQAKSKSMKTEQQESKVKSKKHHPTSAKKAPVESSTNKQLKQAIDKQKKAPNKRANEQASFEAFQKLFQ